MTEPAVPAGDGGLSRSALPPAPSARLRLDLAYDGTDFAGWARQPGLRTVEQSLVDALTVVLRLAVQAEVTVAGRTDAGVHAIGQVAHVDVPRTSLRLDEGDERPAMTPTLLGRRLRGKLPSDLTVSGVSVAPPGFEARYSALGRRYAYRVTDAVAPNPLRRHDTLHWARPLDVDAMQRAADALLGRHDFASYCRPREGATTIRTLLGLDVARDAEGVVVLSLHADAFCHNQVRAMVGALIAVGEGRQVVAWPGEILAARERVSSVIVARAHGLTLVGVDYPPDDQLADRTLLTRQRRELP